MKKAMITGTVAIALSVIGIFCLQNRSNKVDLPVSLPAGELPDTASTVQTSSDNRGQMDNKPDSAASSYGKDLTVVKADGKVRVTDDAFHRVIYTYDAGDKKKLGLISNVDDRIQVYNYNAGEEKLVKLFDIDHCAQAKILKGSSGVVYMGRIQDGERGGKLVYLKGDGTGRQFG